MRALYQCYGGVDDGYFKRGWRYTVLALALHCGDKLTPSYIGFELVRVDGADATFRIVELVRRSLTRFRFDIELLLLDTPVFAGFNIADPAYIHTTLGIAVASIYHYPPNRDAIVKALEKTFPGETWRLKILERDWARLRKLHCPKGLLYVAAYGVTVTELYTKICMLQRFTRTPEPLYTAGAAASAASRLRGVKLKSP